MKRFAVFAVIFLFSLFPFFAVEPSLFFTAGPKLMVNTDDSKKSAPSPVMYSLGVGGDFTFPNGILLQAHGAFFTNYYLWDGKDAQPAEVENRTATALSMMLDLTGGCKFAFGETKNHLLLFTAGAGIFLRHAILSGGVDSNDPNRDTNTTAGDDVSSINGTFFSDLNFFYPEAAISYSYVLSEKWKIGGEARAYLPLGSLINDKGIDGMIFSLALKLSYK